MRGDVIYRNNDITIGKTPQQSAKHAKEKWGEHWKIIRYHLMAKHALDNSESVVSIRDPHKPSERLKAALQQSKKDKGHILVYEKANRDEELTEDSNTKSFVYNGGALSFYSNKVMEIDGVKSPTVLLTDFWDDLSWAGIAKEGGVKLKNGKKPERLLKRIIEMVCTAPGDIVLDYHLGSGTTAAVAHKLGQKYIGIEQLDYGDNDSLVRLQNVINGDQSGISKIVNWQGGGEFVYCELMKYNEVFMERIRDAKTSDQLVKLWKDMSENSFLNWYFNPSSPEKALSGFTAIADEQGGFKKQKQLLVSLLDKNQLYVNLTEIEDAQFDISKTDKELNREFYGKVYDA